MKSIKYFLIVLASVSLLSGCEKSVKVIDPPIVVKPKPSCTSCKMISSAAELAALTLNAGDTVMMKSGDWNNQRLIFKGNGTAQAAIVLIAEKAGEVNLKGASSLAIDGQWLVVDGLNFNNGNLGVSKLNVVDFSSASRNCRLTNTSIVDYSPANQTIDYRWVSMNGKNNRMDHCYLKGKAHQGPTVVLWGASTAISHRIDHNYFGARPDLGNNGGETIRVGTSEYYLSEALVLIEQNIFEHCNGETEIISNKMSKNVIRNNFFFESRGTLSLRHGNGTEVYGNYFVGNDVKDAGGIRIIGENHLVYNNYLQGIATTGQTCAIAILDGVPHSEPSGYFQVKNVKIVGNTIVNCAQAFDIGAGKGGNGRTVPPADCTIANNLIQAKGGIAIAYTDQPQNFFYEGNLAFGMGGGQTLALPTGFLQEDAKLEVVDLNTYFPVAGSVALGGFKGSYNFFQSVNVGSNALDELHKALLKCVDIGPARLSLGGLLTIKK
ncbi:polysaccharide lyase 6 family protein [Pedobacter insulae]|uniref:Poly(Beta-D-mannuronate) lyase n=1 Tax=Pedobacter insulae TaxID=414048 RepID=A0A1I2UXQ2_9SPHI|nr:polysaccharide lyase 6 family protein [Pedobacter insulae]SFG81723.1 poly(beta-D-mannuronate) lyase [Pedobacter insulae]